MPPMNFSASEIDAGVPLRANVEVVIDSTGIPDMSTFKAYGTAASNNRDALYRWVQSSIFQPATRNGQPVSGVYHTRMEFRVPKR